MMAARVSMVVRGLAEARQSPRALIEQLDEFYFKYYAHHAEKLFFSFLACRIDLDNRVLTYSAAGHPGPFIVRARSVQGMHFRTQNLLIGVEQSSLIESSEDSIYLEPEDRIVLYTDGVTDVSLNDSKPIGREGLESLVRKMASRNIIDLGDRITETLGNASSESVQDDRTLILAEIK